MRKADIANPPVFSLSEETRGRLTLTSDTGAVAHLFVLEPDLFRLMVLPDGALRHPRSWTVAPGADDVASGPDGHDIFCAPDSLHTVSKALESVLGQADSAKLDWKPTMMVEVGGDKAQALMDFLEVLEDNDDVQRVSANYEISDEVMSRLGG